MTVSVALDTSGIPGSVAVRRGERVLERDLGPGSVHGRALLPALAECLAEVGGAPSEIDLVVVGTGPGSYTGLRVGIAAARALAFARRCPLLGIPSARAIATSARVDGDVLVAIDAHRGEVYLSRHRPPRGTIALAPRLATPEEIPRFAGCARLVAGNGALLHRERILSYGLDVGRETPALAAALLSIGWDERDRAEPASVAAVEPLYLRLSAAEAKRAQENSSGGAEGGPQEPTPPKS